MKEKFYAVGQFLTKRVLLYRTAPLFLLICFFILAYIPLVAQIQIGQDIDGEVAGDWSGSSISLSSDGTVVAIGARYNDGNGVNAGHVRVYHNVSGTWMQVGQDIDGEAADDESGYAVSISSDGTVVAIGARYNDGNGVNAGHVRVYRHISGTWTQVGQDIDGEAVNDNSGYSVSLSADGTVVAIGAPWNISSWNHKEYGFAAGHVRVYRNESDIWTQIGQDINGIARDWSGISVSLSADGTTVAVGEPWNRNKNGDFAGRVRVYCNESDTWTKVGKDIRGEAAYDGSGISVSLSADGTTVAIGARGNDGNGGNNVGHVRVYRNESDTWTQVGEDIDGEADGDQSGTSVSLSADGSVVAIGALLNDGNGDSTGHVRIYHNVSNTWTQVGQDIDGEAARDESGTSVSLSADGTTVAIGAPLNDGNGDSTGHVRVYNINVETEDVSISAVASSVDEGTDATFTLTRTATSGTLTVNVKVIQQGDYIAGTAPTTISFADGEATTTLAVSTLDDDTDEADGSITVIVTPGIGYALGSPSSAEVGITDNDIVVPVISITADASITEGAVAEFTLTRTISSGVLTVNIEVTQEGEYVDANAVGAQTVNFVDREATATLTITTINDEVDGVDGTITATISNGTGYIVGMPASAMVSITDNSDGTTLGGLQDRNGEGLCPNPVEDWLYVQTSGKGRYRLTVYTLSGRRERTYRIKMGQNTTSLDVSDIPSGVYVITLTDADGQITHYRVVKE